MLKKDEISSDKLDDYVSKDIKASDKEELTLFLSQKNIAISISDSEDIEQLGFSKIHQQDIILEITRYLIINHATLLYGGDLRAQGYTFLFSEIVEQYIHKKENKKYFKNFFSFPIYIDMTQKQKLDFKKNGVDVITIKPPKGLAVDETKFYIPNNNENLFVWAECLTEMRKKMTELNDARIFMGGAKTNFKGKYPGLLEEAIMSLNSNIPTYFIGAFGGVTKNIIEALQGVKPNELTETWQRDSNPKYSEFIDFYNLIPKIEKIDYNRTLDFLNSYSLERLCKNNGLNKEDNIRLFETIHFPEIIFLVLKGLKATLK